MQFEEKQLAQVLDLLVCVIHQHDDISDFLLHFDHVGEHQVND